MKPSARVLRLVAACAVIVAAYSFLPFAAAPTHNSPDEASNAFFSAQFARTGTLWHFDPLNLPGRGVVHPRSMRVVDDLTVPGGFIGLPVLYGGIGRLFGVGVIPYLTPMFALFGVAAWHGIASWLFGRKIGIAAAFLLAVHPAWWYGASRTLQPNVLFASLVIVAAWLMLAAPIKAAVERRAQDGARLLRLSDAAFAGIAFALALAVRMAEAYWLGIGIVLLVAFAVRRGRMPWTRFAVFVVTAALALAPFLAINHSLYGHPLATGYGSGVDVPVDNLPRGMGDRLLGPLRPLLFPLGFAPRTALANGWTYGIAFFGWWSVLVLCAAVAAAGTWKRQPESWRKDAVAYALVSCAVAAWLVPFYGSWILHDNPDPEAVTIGSSYLRYWLPAFVLSTIPVAWLAVTGAERAPRTRQGRALLVIAAFLYVASSGLDVFWGKDEGLFAVRDALARNEAVAKEITRLTPAQSVIVVDRADKFLFPARSVVTPLRSDATYAALGPLSRFADVWYFGITFPERDIAWLRAQKLAPAGLDIVPVQAFGEETLYRLAPVEARAQP